MQSLYEQLQYVNQINNLTLPSLMQYLNFLLTPHMGDYKMSAMNEDFGGWMICDGRSVSRNTYDKLFEVIGTSFGSSDSNTFNLPDFRGRVFGAIGSGSNLSYRSLGDIVGAETHSLTSNEMPSHTHTAFSESNGSHTHTINNAGNHSHGITDPGHTHTQTTINDDFNNSGTNPPGFTADSAGAMTWNNINTNVTGISINSNGDHTHTMSSNGLHAHTITINTSGSNVAHNNMQPTLFGGHIFIFAGLPMVEPVL